MSSNIPANPTYGVYISQLIKIKRICDTFQSFVIRHRLLTERLIRQGFWYSKLCTFFKKFVRRNNALSSKYGVSAEYKITVGQQPISGQLTKLTTQNVTWSVFMSEQVSALSLLPRKTDRSFMGGVWICACAGVYQTCGAKSVGVASCTRDRSTCHGGKVVSATCV